MDQRVDSRTNSPLPHSLTVAFPSTVPAGTYDLTVVTFDGYDGRADSTQPAEQVVLGLGAASFGPTPDLPDGDDHATTTTGGEIELVGDIDTLVVTHRLSDTADNNSVGVSCVSLTAVAPPPPPPPPPSVDVEILLDQRCTPGSSIFVEFQNLGGSTTGSVTVDGVVTTVQIPIDVATSVVIPAEPGIRLVVIEASGVVLFDGEFEVTCEVPDPGEDPEADPFEASPGEDPAEEDPAAPGAGSGNEGSSNGGATSGSTPGSAPSTSSPPAAVLAPLGFLPELALRVECADASIEAVVDNVGDLDGGVTLAVAPSASAVGAEVAAASTTTVTLPLPGDAEGSVTEVVLVTDDGTVLTDEIEIDCLGPADPVAEVTVDCAAGTVAVLVENAGGESIVVRAFAEQVALLGSDELAGGAATTYEVEIAGATVPVRIISDDGRDILRDEIEHGCSQTDLDPGLSLVCPSGDLQLRITNASDEPRTAVVAVGDDAETVTLTGGAETLLVRALDDTPSVRVTSAFGDVLLDQSLDDWACEAAPGDADCAVTQRVADQWVVSDDGGVVPCSGFQSRLVLDCATDVGVVEIGNGTDRAATVAVDADGEPVGRFDVAVQQTGSLAVESAGGARITADAGPDRLLDTIADCRGEPDRTAAVLSGLLVALMSIVAVVVARFDPWIRV
ncbi:MAG: hypothetical protein AAGA90_20375 [Actinomycetota bacterium]